MRSPLLQELHIDIKKATLMYCDIVSTVYLSTDEISSMVLNKMKETASKMTPLHLGTTVHLYTNFAAVAAHVKP